MDYNATAPIRKSVIETVANVMAVVGNPSSVSVQGEPRAFSGEEARSKIAALTGSRVRDVTFCSGGTEANNAVIRGSNAASIIISTIEHDCGIAAAALAGVPVYQLPVSSDGVVDLEALSALLEKAPKPALVSVMLANNETGVIQPVSQVTDIAKQFDARVHTDAIQAAGKLELDFSTLGVDYLTLSSHKIGGPQGVGAIVTAPTAPLKPLVAGGGQELGRRSGTENVAGIAGFGVAALEALEELPDTVRLTAMRSRFEEAVRQASNDAVVIGAAADRIANTSCVAMPGVKGETQVMHFDLNGVCLSSGSACSSGKVKVSHVLTAMGYAPELAEASIRVSLGRHTKEEDVDQLITAWQSLYKRTAAR